LGTRSSALARWQAEWVAARLRACRYEVDLVPVTTTGDVLHGPLDQAGGVGVFTKELQHALLDGRIDLAVHSLKDLPTEPVAGLSVAATPPRESVRDALISRNGAKRMELAEGAVIGTGSLRRRAQLLHLRPDLQMAEIRGNVDTRLRKLDADEFDAIVLAEAGLRRLNFLPRVSDFFDPLEMLPAPGQGALGIEIRTEDDQTRTAVNALHDAATFAAVIAERSLLATLRGGCLAPVGAWARIAEDGALRLDAVVLSADGQTRALATGFGEIGSAALTGREVAQSLLAQGAANLIRDARAVV
jgi:hydroxymethylbilane synthase